MKELDDKEIIETLDSILGVYIDMTHIAILTDEFRNRCRQVVNHLKQLISQSIENDEIHLQMIDIILDLYEQLEQSQSERQVDEEWIEEKVDKFMLQCPGVIAWHRESVKKFIKDFIRSIVSEIQKPRITREVMDEKWVEKKANKMIEIVLTGKNVKKFICQIVQEIQKLYEGG